MRVIVSDDQIQGESPHKFVEIALVSPTPNEASESLEVAFVTVIDLEVSHLGEIFHVHPTTVDPIETAHRNRHLL
ncbi:hypothetical protein ASF76_11925 [Microbacterium sp. Leaf151]|nr:hypothetical protein ASF76_11925 [Microbacterium sp. Leaf151]